MTTMIGPLARAVGVGPERCAVRCGEVELSYTQMWERARGLVGALHGAGMVLVPLNQRHTGAELGYAAPFWEGRRTMVAGA